MLKRLSLSQKLTLSSVLIGLLIPCFGAIKYFQAKEVEKLTGHVSTVTLPKTELLGELAYTFRRIRINIRTVPIRGISNEDIDKNLNLTKETVGQFLEIKKKYQAQISSEYESKLFEDYNTKWEDFFKLGGTLIELGSTHDPQKLDEMAQLVRDVCPVKAEKVESALEALVDFQKAESAKFVALANSAESSSFFFGIVFSIIGLGLSIVVGWSMSRTISKQLTNLAKSLTESSTAVLLASKQVSDNGSALSSATNEQAAALQETVSAMEEISSMIRKNTENAETSKTSAEASFTSASSGKDMVNQLVVDIEDIQKSTSELLDSVHTSNEEMSKIVSIIHEIETKTRVINEIVFQTKLLSFNASVEAARAGEAGNGFAVVAQEVGNLAAMSGKSAKEISDLLSRSIEMVQRIIASTKSKLEQQARDSKQQVEQGIEKSHLCSKSLEEILEGTQNVSKMIGEIAVASQEQAKGVSEVTNAMNQIDSSTGKSAVVSASSATAAEQLNYQAVLMQSLVKQLNSTIDGSTKDMSNSTSTAAGQGTNRVEKTDNLEAA